MRPLKYMSNRNLEIYHEVIDGATHEAAAVAYGITRGRVSQIVDQVERWLRPNWQGKIDVIKEAHTQTLLDLFAESMRGWRRSQRDVVEIEYAAGEEGALIESKRKVKGQAGNAAFLREAREALADIRKIWGVDAPQKVTPIGEDGQPAVIVIQQAKEEIRQELLKEYVEEIEPVAVPAVSSNGNGNHVESG